MEAVPFNRNVARPLVLFACFTTEDLVLGMVLLALHQTFDGRGNRLLVLAGLFLVWVFWLRFARRPGHDRHLFLSLVQPRRLRAGGRGRSCPWDGLPGPTTEAAA